MDLARLKERNAKNVLPVEYDGETWHLRKLTVAAGQAIRAAYIKAGHTDPEGTEPDSEQLGEAYALMLSKTLCDPAGKLAFDSDEGRDELRNLDREAAQFLFDKAQEWNDLADSKKN